MKPNIFDYSVPQTADDANFQFDYTKDVTTINGQSIFDYSNRPPFAATKTKVQRETDDAELHSLGFMATKTNTVREADDASGNPLLALLTKTEAQRERDDQ